MTASKPTLWPLTGNVWVPAWSIRPGSYAALRGVEHAMPLWLAIASTHDHWRPCYYTCDQLGQAIGVSDRTVGRHLKALRRAHLLLSIDRGTDRHTLRQRPPARWAADPFKIDVWTEKIADHLRRIAENDGHDGHWHRRAEAELARFAGRSAGLRNKLADDMPFRLRPKRRRRRNSEKSSRG